MEIIKAGRIKLGDKVIHETKEYYPTKGIFVTILLTDKVVEIKQFGLLIVMLLESGHNKTFTIYDEVIINTCNEHITTIFGP
jgi:hypothetical protein